MSRERATRRSPPPTRVAVRATTALVACLATIATALASSAQDAIPTVSVGIDTVPSQLIELSKLSDAEPGTGVTRLIFTEKDVAGREYVKSLMSDAGLVIREDAMGNIFGRWVGSEPDLPAVGSGSHADAIPQSGLYDGCLGVIGPIEAIAALKRAGFKPKRSIEALMFTSEEPTRFGISCVGIIIYRGAYFGLYDTSKAAINQYGFWGKFFLGYAVTTVAGLAELKSIILDDLLHRLPPASVPRSMRRSSARARS